jgi:hypothetical protein
MFNGSAYLMYPRQAEGQKNTENQEQKQEQKQELKQSLHM